jgi:hypothetical protein
MRRIHRAWWRAGTTDSTEIATVAYPAWAD